MDEALLGGAHLLAEVAGDWSLNARKLSLARQRANSEDAAPAMRPPPQQPPPTSGTAAPDERELLSRLRAGDREAFAALVALHGGPLLRLAITGTTIIVVSITGLVLFEDYSPRAILKRLRA